MMFRKFDRELELVKLQIAANDCLADVQVSIPAYLGGTIALFVFGVSVMMQYPNSSPNISGVVQFVSLMALGLLGLFLVVALVAFLRYRKGVRKLDGYEKDFRARKPLPLSLRCVA